MNASRFRVLLAIFVAMLVLACDLGQLAAPTPTPEPTATPTATLTPTSTPTPTATATPRLVVMWPPLLYAQIADQYGPSFQYMLWHYVSEDAMIKVVFRQIDEGELYTATFEHDGEGWVLLEIKPMETPAPTATPKAGRKAESG